MLRRHAKARSATGGTIQGDFSHSVKYPSPYAHEKRIQELSRSIEESQKNADRLLEEMHLREKQQLEMQEELEMLKELLKSERQTLGDLTCNYDKLKALCDEKDSALQSALVDRNSLEAELARRRV